MNPEHNSEAEVATPVEAESTNEETLEANDTDHGNDSPREGDGEESTSQRRTERAEFFKRKEELEKEYQEKLNSLESQKVDYKESEGSDRQVGSDKLSRMERELAEVTLKTEGITHQDDIDQLLEISDKMSMTPKEVANLTWVQAMLKDNATVRRNTAATPSSSNRNGQKSAKDSIGYWLNRTDLPSKENKELRRQVIHARAQAQNKSQMFNN